MNAIEKVNYHWRMHKEAIDEATTEINSMLLYYDGNNIKAIMALANKLTDMIDRLGQPKSAIEFLKRLVKGTMYKYGIPYDVYCTKHNENVVKLKSEFNPKKYERIESGHFRWNFDIVYKLDRYDFDFLNDYFFKGIRNKKTKIFPFEIERITIPMYDNVQTIEFYTPKGNQYRMCIYPDGRIVANWIIGDIDNKLKVWAVDYLNLSHEKFGL